MDTAVSLLLTGLFLFLMMRFGCGAHMFGAGGHKGHSQNHGGGCCGPDGGGDRREPGKQEQPRWTAPEKDTDPICGATVSPDKAKSTVYDGWVYYFCSHECREVFEVSPESHLGREQGEPPSRLAHLPEEERGRA